MPLADDQHPVSDFGPGGEHEPFRVSVRARAPGRDLRGLDTGISQDCVERCGELPGPVADQEPKLCGAITQVHQQVADLLHGPRPVRVGGDSEDVHVTAADLHDEQAVQPLQGHCAVNVEEVGGEHRRGLRVQELPPGRVSVPLGCREIFRALRTRRMVDALTRWPSLSSSPWILLYPQALFSVASRSMRVAISALTGGRPVRFG